MPPCIVLNSYAIQETKEGISLELVFPASLPVQLFRKVVSTIQFSFPGSTVAVTKALAADWFDSNCTLMIQADRSILTSLRLLLSTMCYHLVIFDALDVSHALAPYVLFVGTEDSAEKTDVGKLVYSAKYQLNKSAAAQLGTILAGFVEKHPLYARADVICPVPPSDLGKRFHLATHLAHQMSDRFGKMYVRPEKTRTTLEQKNISDEGEKRSNLSGSMLVRDDLTGMTVIALDDLYHSGNSLEELARACRTAGASKILGLAAAKNRKYLRVLSVEDFADRWIAK